MCVDVTHSLEQIVECSSDFTQKIGLSFEVQCHPLSVLVALPSAPSCAAAPGSCRVEPSAHKIDQSLRFFAASHSSPSWLSFRIS